jgi:ubiquinone/menaquinone biosynthesis C-methylase UbiE
MPDHETIYRQQAEQYHELIAKQPALGKIIASIRNYDHLDVVDLGAGSGRLACELAPAARSLIALDASEAMLRVAASRLEALGLRNWRTQAADHRRLPLPDDSADLIVSGWSISYLASSENSGWEDNLQLVMKEMQRVLRPGGTIVILETLGTGHTSPYPPHFLKAYYDSLKHVYGFSQQWIRLDYTFETAAQAEALIRFFFSDELAAEVAAGQWTIVPECAGIWWLHLPENK